MGGGVAAPPFLRQCSGESPWPDAGELKLTGAIPIARGAADIFSTLLGLTIWKGTGVP